MRDLNLGPLSRKLIENFHTLERQRAEDDGANYTEHTGNIAACATAMAAMLERWMDVAWCWPCAAPARICGGPHVRVSYRDDKMGSKFKPCEIIEPADHVGETFPDVPFTIIRS